MNGFGSGISRTCCESEQTAERDRATLASSAARAIPSLPIQTIEIGPNHRVFVSGAPDLPEGPGPRPDLKHHYTYGFRAHYDSIDRVHTQDGFMSSADSSSTMGV